jgi:hypothetical protein
MHVAKPAKSRDHFGHALLLMPRIAPVFGQRSNKFDKIIPSPLEKYLNFIITESKEPRPKAVVLLRLPKAFAYNQRVIVRDRTSLRPFCSTSTK